MLSDSLSAINDALDITSGYSNTLTDSDLFLHRVKERSYH